MFRKARLIAALTALLGLFALVGGDANIPNVPGLSPQVANAYNYCGPTGSLGGGNDTWTGTSFADKCSGGDGNDNMAGKGDNDLLYGDAGSDYLQGDGGYDKLHGGGGTFNRLYGNDGDDEMWSVNGNATDAFVGGSGFNICHGDWQRSTGAHDSRNGCDIMYWTYF